MATEVSGIISSDQTWSGNITVTGSIKVTNGATLTISAGTQITVQSGGDYKIWIDSTGFLVADTNANDISISSDGSGTDDWKGIEFTDNTSSNSSSGSSLKGVTISNATYGVNVEGQGILIDDCVFENNGKSIYLTNTDSVKITNSTFKDTNGCIDTPYEVTGYGPHNNTEISNNNFLGGGTAVAIWPNQRNVDNLTIKNNLVADSHSLGFKVGGGGYGSHIGDVEISNNEIKSTSGISIDAYSWVNDNTPGLKINKNYISGTGTGIGFGHADNFSANNIQINENHFINNGTSLYYGNDQNFGTGPHFSLTGNVFDSVGIGTDLNGLAVTASSNSFTNTTNYVIKNVNTNTTFLNNNITGFSGTSVFHTRDTSNLGTAISLGTNYFDSTSQSADLADDGAENFEYQTIEVSGYAGSEYSVSLPVDVPTNAAPTLTGSKKSFSDGIENTNYLITKTDLLTGYSDAEFDTLSISNLTFSSGSSSQSGNNYTYTPTSNTTGSITFTYSISDGDGGTISSSNSFTLQASDEGDAVFEISGTTEVGQALSITESTADPDGTGTLSYVWQSSSDESTWTQI
ncbi:cadherin-like domain-containing protein, partial [uncultured Prochlorococcus sp.]|uniref:cadherin-like domain-containing protein n=1 Tax=uncultured Prochlorococcus sp. TaxID=159733 RepID=UPI00258E261F